MSRRLRAALIAITLGTALTGLAFVAMRELLRNDDPFSAYNHPLQPWALAAHVLLAPALVLLIGWLWGVHVVPRLRAPNGAGRRTGLANLTLGLTMIASGYALEVTALPPLRLALAWLHGLSGAGFLVVLALHARRRVEARHAAGSGAPAPPPVEIRTGACARGR